jgi:hypothetical protein
MIPFNMNVKFCKDFLGELSLRLVILLAFVSCGTVKVPFSITIITQL